MEQTEENEEHIQLTANVTLVHGLPIKTVCLLDAKRQKEPSKFISNICQGAWDRENLSNRCVKQSKKCDRPELSPQKIKCILKEFELWLSSEGYNKDAIATQLTLALQSILAELLLRREKNQHYNPLKPFQILTRNNHILILLLCCRIYKQFIYQAAYIFYINYIFISHMCF